jgi:rubrerythrin
MTDNRAVSKCTGKVAFTDPKLARRAAKRKSNREAYRCQDCGHWHVGGNAKLNRKNRKKGDRWVNGVGGEI